MGDGGFSCRAIAVLVQWISSTVMRVWKHRATRKTGYGWRKVISARDDRHLLHMAMNDRTASSRKLAARKSTATSVLIWASSIRWCPPTCFKDCLRLLFSLTYAIFTTLTSCCKHYYTFSYVFPLFVLCGQRNAFTSNISLSYFLKKKLIYNWK